MFGNLVQINKATSTGSSSTLTVTGIDNNSIYVVYYSVRPVDNDKDLLVRVTTGGTPDSDSEYDMTGVFQRADASPSTSDIENGVAWYMNSAMENDSAKWSNNILYLFNFNHATEYSYVTMDTCGWNDTIQSVGDKGGGVHTVAETNDGLSLSNESNSNFASGSKMVLYEMIVS